jgi:hypothetical protein
MDMSNLASTQKSSLIPSPLHASEPQNEMELRLQQLIYAGLNSGTPIEYTSATAFADSMRERSAARPAKTARKFSQD